MKKKIPILYITPSSGHYKAAKALKKSVKFVDRNCDAISIDALKFLHPWVEGFVNWCYALVIKKIPFIWGRIYDKKKVISCLNPIKRFIHYVDRLKVKNLFARIKPDVVVCTQAFPCGVVCSYKRFIDPKIKLVACITDFMPHRFWIYEEVDYFTVAGEEAKNYLVAEGVPPEKIKPAGIPILPQFRHILRKESRQNLGIDENIPVVLLLGGGSGIGSLKEVARYLDILELDLQIIIVCGRNHQLYQWFKTNKKFFKKKIIVYSYVDFVDKLMDVADVIVTKPGGITISEALAKRLAIVLVNPIPGQEERNMHFLVKKKIALKAEDSYQAALLIKSILKDKNLSEELRNNAYAFSRPESSLDIIRLVLNL